MNNLWFLHNDVVGLKAITSEYAHQLALIISDRDVTNMMVMGTFPTTTSKCKEEIESINDTIVGPLQNNKLPTNIILSVHPIGTDQYVGNIGLYHINWVNRSAELRAIFKNSANARGRIVYEAHKLFINYAFGMLNLRRLHGGYIEGHASSSMSLSKVGFIKEGVLRKELLRGGSSYDVILMGLLAEEFYTLFPSSKTEFDPSWRKHELADDSK